MNTDLFDRYATLDPSETPEALPDWTSMAPVLLAEIDERTHPMQTQHRPNTSTEPKRRWTGVLVAAAAFAIVLIVGVSLVLLNRGGDPLDTVAPVTTTTAAVQTTAAPATTVPTTTPSAAVAVPGEWDPILGETQAKADPPAASCPAGSDPNMPGSPDQERPAPGPWNNQSAAFDRHAGRVVFVDETGETWEFDVCTNTWRQTGAEWNAYALHMGLLVYDIDSDRTIAIGSGGTALYDADGNTWTQRSASVGPDLGSDVTVLGTVYDPMSGLTVALADDGTLLAYDVESDKWTPIGPIGDPPGYPPFLVGHHAGTDNLVLLSFDGAPFQGDGVQVDPRSGASTRLDGPSGGVAGGFGSFTYATGGDTAYVWSDGPCRLDSDASSWTCAPLTADGAPRPIQIPSAMVYDSINERLIVFNDWCCVWPGSPTTDDVWAIDLDTGIWTQLLAPSDT